MSLATNLNIGIKLTVVPAGNTAAGSWAYLVGGAKKGNPVFHQSGSDGSSINTPLKHGVTSFTAANLEDGVTYWFYVTSLNHGTLYTSNVESYAVPAPVPVPTDTAKKAIVYSKLVNFETQYFVTAYDRTGVLGNFPLGCSPAGLDAKVLGNRVIVAGYRFIGTTTSIEGFIREFNFDGSLAQPEVIFGDSAVRVPKITLMRDGSVVVSTIQQVASTNPPYENLADSSWILRRDPETTAYKNLGRLNWAFGPDVNPIPRTPAVFGNAAQHPDGTFRLYENNDGYQNLAQLIAKVDASGVTVVAADARFKSGWMVGLTPESGNEAPVYETMEIALLAQGDGLMIGYGSYYRTGMSPWSVVSKLLADGTSQFWALVDIPCTKSKPRYLAPVAAGVRLFYAASAADGEDGSFTGWHHTIVKPDGTWSAPQLISNTGFQDTLLGCADGEPYLTNEHTIALAHWI